MSFQISPELNKNKIFLVKCSALEERFDPIYNLALIENKITSHYQKQRIKNLCKSLTGGTPSKANPTFWTGNIPWVSPKDMKNFYLSDTIDHITEKAIKESSTNIIPKNSVLIVVRSGILQHTIPVSVATREMAINQDVKALIFNECVLPAYPAYFIDVYQSKMLPLIAKHGTTVQSINTDQFDKLKIPVPPRKVQAKIVAKMDIAYAAKKRREAEARQLLDSIDEYLLGELGIELPEQEENTVQSRIFTRRLSNVSGGRLDPDYYRATYKKLEISASSSKFSTKTLKKITSLISNGSTPASNEYSEKETLYPIIKAGSYKGDFVDLSKTGYANAERIRLAEKDDLFVLSAAHQSDYVGRSLKYLEDPPKANTSFVGELICIRANQEICNPMYLYSLLNTNLYKDLLNREKTGQTSHLYPKDIQYINIPMPEKEKQIEIANHITTIRKKAKQLQRQAKLGLEQAKKEVEAMILGENEG